MSEHDEQIPSELVNLKEVYQRRLLRRKEVTDKMNQDLIASLQPLADEHKRAVRAFEDHFDDALVKYGRDPKAMPLDDRDPLEAKRARALARAVEDAESQVRRKEHDLVRKLQEMPEYAAFKKAQEEFEDWLAKVCLHLKCCPADLSWEERRISRQGKPAEVPQEILAVPHP